MQSLYGLLFDLGLPRAAGLSILAVAIGALLYYSRHLGLVKTFAVMGVEASLLAMHTMGYDLLFGLVSIATLGEELRSSYRDLAAVLFLSPLPYFADRIWHIGALRKMIFVFSGVAIWGIFKRGDSPTTAPVLEPRPAN